MTDSETMLIALTRIERAVDSYSGDDSDAAAILTDIRKFAREGIAGFHIPVEAIR